MSSPSTPKTPKTPRTPITPTSMRDKIEFVYGSPLKDLDSNFPKITGKFWFISFVSINLPLEPNKYVLSFGFTFLTLLTMGVYTDPYTNVL